MISSMTLIATLIFATSTFAGEKSIKIITDTQSIGTKFTSVYPICRKTARTNSAMWEKVKTCLLSAKDLEAT